MSCTPFLGHEIVQTSNKLVAPVNIRIDDCCVLVCGSEFRVSQAGDLVDVVADMPDFAADAFEFGCARSLAQKRSGPLPGRFQSVVCMVSPSRDMSR